MPHPALARWPAVDDCLLKLACESGVALESLCGLNACVSFEKARALDEVRHRWRMMLTDDAFSNACVARMREVTDEEIEKALNEWTDQGWTYDGMQFAMRDGREPWAISTQRLGP